MFKINSGSMKFIVLLFGIILLLMIPFSSALAAGQRQEGAPPAFNLLEFLKFAGLFYLPTLAIVFGLVDYYGKWGVQGKLQLASSLLTGLIIGGLIMYFTTYPNTPVDWFIVALFGLLVGLGASGCYNGIKTASAKGTGGDGGISEGPQ